MPTTTAIPFREALKHLASKKILPTSLDSAGIAEKISAAVRRQSTFSARTLLEDYLTEIQTTVESLVNPKQVGRGGVSPSQTVTEGYNPATAREALRNKLRELGYAPEEDVAGTIKDLSSDARINLVVKTNTELAQGAGAFLKQNASAEGVDLYPAIELYRLEDKDHPRDWETRWKLCAQVVGDVDAARVLEETGRMVALKSSRIWQALGDGEDGSTDTLGNPYPPFAFNSGMWTQDIARDEAEELGLLKKGEAAEPADFDLDSLFATPEAIAA